MKSDSRLVQADGLSVNVPQIIYNVLHYKTVLLLLLPFTLRELSFGCNGHEPNVLGNIRNFIIIPHSLHSTAVNVALGKIHSLLQDNAVGPAERGMGNRQIDQHIC